MHATTSMHAIQKLEMRLLTYPWGVHKNSRSSTIILQKTRKQISKINNALTEEDKFLHKKKLTNLARGWVAYCEVRGFSEDLKNIFTKYLRKLSENDFTTIELHMTLKYVLKFYTKDSIPSIESKKAIKAIRALIKNIADKKTENEKIEALIELKKKCQDFVSQNPKRNLTSLLKTTVDFCEFNREELNLSLNPLPTNKTKVLIWDPQTNLTSGSVGHVATVVGGLYISLYPLQEISSIKEITQAITPLFHTLEQDISSEGRPADHEIEFHHLDIAAMKKGYKVLKHVVHWQGTASGEEKNQPLTLRNCSSMAATLLVLGGIRDFFPETERKDVFPTIRTAEELNEEIDRLRIAKRKKTIVKNKYKVETVSPTGAAGYVGVQCYKLFDRIKIRKLTLPGNFLSQIKRASQLEKGLYGSSLLSLPTEDRQKKLRIEEEIKKIVGKELKQVFREYGFKLTQMAHDLHSNRKRFKHSIGIALMGDITSKNFFDAYIANNLMATYRRLKITYKNLINECIFEQDNQFKSILAKNKDFLLNIEEQLRESYEKNIVILQGKCLTEIPSNILKQEDTEPKEISLEKLKRKKEKEQKQKHEEVPSSVAKNVKMFDRVLKGQTSVPKPSHRNNSNRHTTSFQNRKSYFETSNTAHSAPSTPLIKSRRLTVSQLTSDYEKNRHEENKAPPFLRTQSEIFTPISLNKRKFAPTPPPSPYAKERKVETPKSPTKLAKISEKASSTTTKNRGTVFNKVLNFENQPKIGDINIITINL